MIHSLSGTVLNVEEDCVVLDVSGFGLEVFSSGSLLLSARAGEFLSCVAYLQVSDASMALFGFSDERERALFLEITQVKTMGGKLSISLLRHLDADAIISAILAGDSSRLAVPGLGPKRAERICFELKSKVEKKFGAIAGGVRRAEGRGSIDAEVVSGLVGLGFSQNEALHALSSCRAESPEREWTEETLMMSSLARLQRFSLR
ncbi:MAG: Holliday junction branch migration protein RuvA [Synergistaceae bacterium]|jgi:Holliday junction DNA helicase RuvA|nr:Holliday junction branch migration protein RuvA [Synergistaceae bacterium]